MRDFNHTVNVLVKAYFNNELAHRSCTACAVGNIIADALGTKPKVDANNNLTGFDNYRFENDVREDWFDVSTASVSQASKQVLLTGYSIEELAAIEYAFERCDDEFLKTCHGISQEYTIQFKKPIGQDDEWMFKGLMAVVDVLAEIHGVDLTQKENAKLLFVKP